MSFVTAREAVEIVPRSRLDGRYADAAGRLVRVLAPGGYGKSALVRRWASGDSREVRWLDLERVDNEPAVLVDMLADAMADFTESSFQELPCVGHGTREFTGTFLRAFGSLVRSCHVPFVLVLDDVHNIDKPRSAAIIATLARNLPGTSTLVVAGRAHHCGDSIGTLRIAPGVIDVAAHDLAFDLAETEEMMSACGVDVDLGAVTELAGLFEGWPAALRLATLVVRSAGGIERQPMSALGDASFVVDFLRSEWIERLLPDEIQFLTEAACLERFTGEMCDDVLGRHGSVALLRHLHLTHLVVTPLDDNVGYRMHPLLARWLSAELRANDRERWRRVHIEAARWRADAGEIELALGHATKAASLPLWESLITAHAGGFFGRGLHGTVREWLETGPSDYRRSSTQLCALTGLANLLSGDGDAALQWSRASRRSATDLTPTGSARDADARMEIIAAAVEPSAATPMVAAAERARQRLAGGAWQAFGCWTLGGLMFVAGDERSVQVLEEGAFEAQVAQAHAMHAACVLTRGLVLDLRGEDDALADSSDVAARLLARHRLEPSLTTTLVAAVRCLVDARDGDRDAAVKHLSTSRARLGGLTGVAPWYNVVTRLALVRSCLLVDLAAEARTLMRETEHHLRFESGPSGLVGQLDPLQASVQAANELLSLRSWSLTAAELKVVQYLPTNLSLADIATRLFVSRNTVKSHVAAIYRKLGTTSRSRAVELAREAGFLAD